MVGRRLSRGVGMHFAAPRIDISLSQAVAAAFLESSLGALGFPPFFCVN